MPDHGCSSQSEQDRSAGRVGMKVVPETAQRRFEQPAGRRQGFFRAAAVSPTTRLTVPSVALVTTFPVKPSVDHVGVPGRQVAAFDVADEVQSPAPTRAA